MLNELKENLNIIYNETSEKLIPRNIKKGVEILGVTGTLEGYKDAYQVKPVITSYTVTNPNNDTYTFVKNGNGYYESNNKAIDSSFAMCKVTFNVLEDGSTITFDCINYAESSFDYGIFSQLDSTLTPSNTADSNAYFSFSGKQSSSVQQVIYSGVNAGQHYIYIKFRKDSSVNSNNDSLQFKLLTESRIYENVYIYGSEELLLADINQADGSYGVVQLDVDEIGDMYKYNASNQTWTKVQKITHSGSCYTTTTDFKNDSLAFGSDYVGVIYEKNGEIPFNFYKIGETKLGDFKDTITLSKPVSELDNYHIDNMTNTEEDYHSNAISVDLTYTNFTLTQKYYEQLHDSALEDYKVIYTSIDGINYTLSQNTFPLNYNIYIRNDNYYYKLKGSYDYRIGEFLYSLGNIFNGIYYKSSSTSSPSRFSTQLYATTAELPNSATVFTQNGVVTGTLFNDIVSGNNVAYKLQTYQRLKNLIEKEDAFTDKDVYISNYTESELYLPVLGNIASMQIQRSSMENIVFTAKNIAYDTNIASNNMLKNVDITFETSSNIAIQENSNLETIKLTGTITSNVFPYMQYNPNLQSVDLTNLLFEGNVTDMSSRFENDAKLTDTGVPIVDTSLVTTFSYCFYRNASLTIVPAYDYSNNKSLNYTFRECTSLVDASNLAIQGLLTSIAYCFYGDTSLTTVPQFDLSNITSYSGYNNAFGNCPALTEESLNNVLATLLTVPSTITSNKTLKYAGLSAEQCTVCASLSNYAALVEAGWTTGY